MRRKSIARRHAAESLGFVMVLATLAIAFVWPAWRACGVFPAPLDDVYIHADFARALASGHPFEWVAGNGYSSGETAPLYPFLLAPGVLLGLDDERLVAFAVAVAVVSLALGCAALRRVLTRLGLARVAGPAALATMVLACAVGTVSFTFFSGMEAACFFGATCIAIDAADEARACVATRKRAARRLGIAGAAMVLLRPEGLVVVAVLALVAARGARSRPVLPSLVRAALPALLATCLVLVTNRALTGDFASAGARLKLLGSNPFLDDVSRAKEVVLNLLAFYWKVLAGELGPFGLGAVLALFVAAATDRRARHVASACALSAIVFALVVSTNGAARYQGFRYYAPAVALVVVAASFGAASLARRLRAPAIAPFGLLLLAATCGPRLLDARAYFRRASVNVHEQQARMGKHIGATLPADAIVLVGDAGAIPYFSRLASIDALGLGGYRRRPFVRAAVHGEGSTLELLEHLPKAERPTHFALYPNWFPRTTSLFGHEIFRVTIDDNVICGGPTKVLYEARFDALGEGDAIDLGFPPAPLKLPVDSVDIADVESEEAHSVTLPVPNGGYPVAKVLRVGERPRYDGGRVVGAKRALGFQVRGLGARALRVLHVRGDDDGFELDVVSPLADCPRLNAKPESGAFTHAHCTVSLGDGDRITLTPSQREARLFHVWTETP